MKLLESEQESVKLEKHNIIVIRKLVKGLFPTRLKQQEVQDHHTILLLLKPKEAI